MIPPVLVLNQDKKCLQVADQRLAWQSIIDYNSRIKSTEAPVFPSVASCLADVSESRSYSVDSSTAESLTSTEITVKSVTLLILTSLVAQDHRIIPL